MEVFTTQNNNKDNIAKHSAKTSCLISFPLPHEEQTIAFHVYN